jgi:multimeric flavodoxin WrbA
MDITRAAASRHVSTKKSPVKGGGNWLEDFRLISNASQRRYSQKDDIMILLINGSPKPNGNVHRMLEKIAVDTGLDYEMIHLARLKISPCLGCVKCAGDNRCIQSDDMAALYEKIVAADALIIGSPVYFGHPNAFTHTFLERLFALRHVRMLTKDMPAAVVTVGGHEAEQVDREIAHHLTHYFCCKVVGSVFFNSATPPCFICGYGATCEYGAPARWMDSEKFGNLKEITPDMFQKFEDHPEIPAKCETLARKIKSAVASTS